jgi:myo-inositol-1(or 4)-monophosphatase
MDTGQLLELGRDVAAAVRAVLDGLDDWGPAGTVPGQYRSDLAADEVAVALLLEAGLGVLSEESGLHEPQRPLLAVLDPVDGSTNAARGLPRFATSLCVLDAIGPLTATVADQATGRLYEAARGEGARRDGRRIAASACTSLGEALVGLSGYPHHYLGWRQYRALGSAALDLCAVADGALDAFVDVTRVPGGGAHGAWDYLGGILVCTEAGAVVADAAGRDLDVREHAGRRTPVAAATPQLLDQVLASLGGDPAGATTIDTR